jgi:hypothetical protein
MTMATGFALRLGAVDVAEQIDHPDRRFIGQSVMDGLAVSAGLDEALSAELRQMLRGGRRRQAHVVRQVADASPWRNRHSRMSRRSLASSFISRAAAEALASRAANSSGLGDNARGRFASLMAPTLELAPLRPKIFTPPWRASGRRP